MILVVHPQNVQVVSQTLRANGETSVYEIGEVISGKGVELKGLETWA